MNTTKENVFKKTQNEKDLTKAARLNHKHAAKVQPRLLHELQQKTLEVLLNPSNTPRWGSIDVRILNYQY